MRGKTLEGQERLKNEDRLRKAFEEAFGDIVDMENVQQAVRKARRFLEEELRRTRERLRDIEKTLSSLERVKRVVEAFQWKSCYVKRVHGRSYLYASVGGRELYLGAVQPVRGKRAPEELVRHLTEKPEIKRAKREVTRKLRNAEEELKKARTQLQNIAQTIEDALRALE